jgi:hypothetical protein
METGGMLPALLSGRCGHLTILLASESDTCRLDFASFLHILYEAVWLYEAGSYAAVHFKNYDLTASTTPTCCPPTHHTAMFATGPMHDSDIS